MLVKAHRYRFIVVVLTILTTAAGTTLPDEEWDKFFHAMNHRAPSAASSSSFKSRPAENVALQQLDTQNSGHDPLRQHDASLSFTSSSERPAEGTYHDLETGPQALQEKRTVVWTPNELQDPGSAWIGDRLQQSSVIGTLRTMSMEEKTQSLRNVQIHFQTAARAKGWTKPPISRPFIQASRETLEAFARDLVDLPHKFGPWRYVVKYERFLVHQIRAKTPNFNEVNGFKYVGDKKLYGVWKEIGSHGWKRFQYVGVFQGPHSRLAQKHKVNSLSQSIMPLKSLEMLGDSSFTVTFKDWVNRGLEGGSELSHPTVH